MKFSFSTLGCPYYTFDQMIELAKKCGYTGIEFRIYQGQEDLRNCPEFGKDNIASTKKRFQEADIKIACLSSSARFAYPDADNQRRQLEHAETYLQMASDLECPYVRIFAGPYPVNFNGHPKSESFIEEYRASIPPEKVAGLTKEECDKWVMEGFYKVGELGKKYGVMPLMETHDDFCSGAVVRRLLDGSGSDNVGILWDCLHPYRYGLDLHETFEEVRSRIHHVHMKDSSDLTPWGFVPALVGNGEMDIRTALDILKTNNYSDFISFEWEKLWFPEVEEPDVAIPQFMEAVTAML